MNMFLIRLEKWLSCALLALLFVLLMIQVVSRYVFSSPLPWTEEAARYAMVWLVFLAAAYMSATDGHITITLLDRVLPNALVRWVKIISRLIVLSACLWMLPDGWKFVDRMFIISSPAASIPMGLVYLAALVGLTLIALHSFVYCINIWQGKERMHEQIADEVNESKESTA